MATAGMPAVKEEAARRVVRAAVVRAVETVAVVTEGGGAHRGWCSALHLRLNPFPVPVT